ncbi:RIP metalloprotease RseP [Planctomicrobium sp. SH668]|uniref:RIP metalloprotease RseP n=1 Tax=Planctomicrobium sp. SH668 TaxID=3448126 RepID=UPI003F5C5501
MDFTLSLINTTSLLNILIAAIGLGMVVFFHELGHFLVAKWCNVYVERFSIGFGPAIWARKYGETEYVLGCLPLGGYVKMYGQDDMDPSQMTDEQVAANPRAYSSKTVLQRMAIISAGVIMNIITGTMCFILVFMWGIDKVDRVAGSVQVGKPAWRHGMRAGDTLTSINGSPIEDFDDVTRHTALSPRGPIRVTGFHDDGKTFDLSLEPETFEIRRIIGVGPAYSLNVMDKSEGVDFGPAIPGSSADSAKFHYGDQIVAVDGVKVEDSRQLFAVLNDHAAKAVQVEVLRKEVDEKGAPKLDDKGDVIRETATVELPSQPFLGSGIKMGIGKIVALQEGSVAAQAGLQVGDRIAKVNGQDVERDLDPFRLTEIFSANAGKEVIVTVTRDAVPGAPETLDLVLTPEDRDPWSEPPTMTNSPLSIPSIGVGYHLVPTVFEVREGSPAAAAGIKQRDTVTKLELTKMPGVSKDVLNLFETSFEIGELNWAHAFWTMQENGRSGPVKLTIKPASAEAAKTVELTPAPIEGWFVPTTRGLLLNVQHVERKAKDFPEAVSMGVRYTINSAQDIYLTLRGLFTRSISPQGLSGPIGIAKLAYRFAGLGLAHFLLFIGLISINLAVINFLPIPVLDGGHMVFLLWEGIFRRKPSEAVVIRATYFGLAFLLSLFAFVIFQDLFISKI